jgi:hypothetical protein
VLFWFFDEVPKKALVFLVLLKNLQSPAVFRWSRIARWPATNLISPGWPSPVEKDSVIGAFIGIAVLFA